MHTKKGNDLVQGKRGALDNDPTMADRASQSDEVDQTILDCLTKRAQLEAFQHQTDQSIGLARVDHAKKQESGASTAATATLSGHGSKKTQYATTNPAGSQEGDAKIKKLAANRASVGTAELLDTSQQQENLMNIVADRASVASAELLYEEMNPTQGDEHNLLQMATEITSVTKLEKSSNKRSADGGQTLMKMATEINEAAKLEEVSNSRRSTERNGSVPERLQHVTPQGTSQLPRPGAYMGTPGEGLRRTNTLRFSLLGAPAPNTDDKEELQIDQGETESMPQVLPNNSNDVRNDQQLAVANLVVEDHEDFEHQMRPSASPVDLQLVEERQQKKRQQVQVFILFLVMLCIVAVITVGTVAGTRKGKDPVTTIRSQTATPTAFGSMQPSGVPSSAPTGILDFIMEDLPNYTLESLQTFGTPQWRAWDWLLDHQNITQLPEWRKMQLFALATFYYSLEGENWFEPIREKWMDDFVDECLWFSSGFSYFENGVYAEYPPSYATLPCNHLGEYTSLWVEDLSLSGLAPVVPPEITLLTSLSQIGLGKNKISSSIDIMLPSEIYKMTALTSLSFAGNRLSGRIPTELGLLTALALRMLDNNDHLSGQIPSELGLLTALTRLRLHYNRLSGWIPSELASMSHLIDLRLQWNQLTGRIPTELGRLTSLEWLFLATNELTGQLATELALLRSLNILWLDTNPLTGQIATQFGTMVNLTVFSASTNLLTGPIPSEFGLLTLKEFWLEVNEFTGEIPNEIWSMASLDKLYFRMNSLTGSLPSQIGLLTSLLELDLSTNRFTGTIPNEVGSMTSLQKLYLYNNSLTGTLPLQLNESMGLRLEGNQFSGDVPEHLCSALWCDCAANSTQVSTCADLHELVSFPGRFPGTRADKDGKQIVLNVESDGNPAETSWFWQKETNSSGVWITLQESGDAIQVPHVLYSFILSLAAKTKYKLTVLDSWGKGFVPSGWITVTTSNQTVLYSFTEVDTPFSKITVDLSVGADGSVEEIISVVECDPVVEFC
ncbi:expressed unknown protein [Seminavis robusta]|uniref:Uncharacterized protein n=1 Tax=Seminavis robusta TaxID=568900 RepID=A0A9N8HFK2_9STRA|nr:expressed unknown protein [Seminavis robusta]|eukprot:Sro527_g160751.1  (1012) ;mRNA; r:53477-56512